MLLPNKSEGCQGLLLRNHYDQLNSKAEDEFHLVQDFSFLLIFLKTSTLLLRMGFASPLTSLPLVVFPKDSYAECPGTFTFFSDLESCFPLWYFVCLEFLDIFYIVTMAFKCPVIFPLAQEDSGAEIVWLKIMFFQYLQPSPKQTVESLPLMEEHNMEQLQCP